MYKYFLSLGFIIVSAYPVISQSWNPFDIDNRTVEDVILTYKEKVNHTVDQDTLERGEEEELYIEDSEKPSSESHIVQHSDNPFEINQLSQPDIEDFEVNLVEVSDREDVFMFIVIVVLYLFVGILVTLYRAFVGKLYRSILNDNYLKFFKRSVNEPIKQRLFLFYLLFFINAGLFLYLSIDLFEWNSWHNRPMLLWFCILILLIFFTFKHLSLLFVSAFFPPKREAGLYNFSIVIFNAFLALILLPVNTLMAYGGDEFASLAFYIGIASWLILLVIRQLKALLLTSNLWLNYVFHFFLYLCAVEIAPICILFKAIQSA